MVYHKLMIICNKNIKDFMMQFEKCKIYTLKGNTIFDIATNPITLNEGVQSHWELTCMVLPLLSLNLHAL